MVEDTHNVLYFGEVIVQAKQMLCQRCDGEASTLNLEDSCWKRSEVGTDQVFKNVLKEFSQVIEN